RRVLFRSPVRRGGVRGIPAGGRLASALAHRCLLGVGEGGASRGVGRASSSLGLQQTAALPRDQAPPRPRRGAPPARRRHERPPPASGAPSLPARRGGVLPAALERSDSVVRARTTD